MSVHPPLPSRAAPLSLSGVTLCDSLYNVIWEIQVVSHPSPVSDLLHHRHDAVWSVGGVCMRDTSSSEDQPVMNNRWMLIHFATIVKSTPVSWLVCTSNHVTVAHVQFV